MSDLKHRLVKIESTSESKSLSGQSLGRAAQLMMAASKKNPSLTPSSSSSSSSSSSPSSSSRSFLNKENTRRPSSASTLSSSPSTSTTARGSTKPGTSSKRGRGRKKDRQSVLEVPPDEGMVLFEEQVKDFLEHVGHALKDATLIELRPKFESCLGRKLTTSEKAVFKRLAIHAVDRLDDPSGVDASDVGLRRTSMKENGWLTAKPSPALHGQERGPRSSPLATPERSKVNNRQLPSWMASAGSSGDGKPCPRCKKLFAASRMNSHILTCRGRQISPSNATGAISSPTTNNLKRRANLPDPVPVPFKSPVAERNGNHFHGSGVRARATFDENARWWRDSTGCLGDNRSGQKEGRGRGRGRGGGGRISGDRVEAGMLDDSDEEQVITVGSGGRGSSATSRRGAGGRGRGARGRGVATRGRGGGSNDARGQGESIRRGRGGRGRGVGRGRGKGTGRGTGRGRTRGGGNNTKDMDNVIFEVPSDSDDDIDVLYSPNAAPRGMYCKTKNHPNAPQGFVPPLSNELPNPWGNSSPSNSDLSADPHSPDSDFDVSMASADLQMAPESQLNFDLVPCPLCMQEFPQCDIAVHAALCGE